MTMTIPSDWYRDSTKLTNVVQGEYKVADDPDTVFSTLLGSCVSACIYDPVRGIGGLNHFLLPGQAGASGGDVKYGAMAMELLINAILRRGGDRFSMKVKLFGGAAIGKGTSTIGAQNARFARDYVLREGFEVEASDLGGVKARRLRFHPATGAVRLLIVPPTPELAAETGEQSARARVSTPRPGGITLF